MNFRNSRKKIRRKAIGDKITIVFFRILKIFELKSEMKKYWYQKLIEVVTP